MVIEPDSLSDALSFAKAVAQEAVAIAKRKPPTLAEIRASRLASCMDCPLVSADRMKCTHCRCWLSIKTQMRSQACPVGRW